MKNLLLAIEENNEKAVEQLLTKEVDLNSPYTSNVRNVDSESSDDDSEDDDLEQYAITQAINNYENYRAKKINEKSQTALNILKKLVDHGADIDIEDETDRSTTPLYDAIENNDHILVEFLLLECNASIKKAGGLNKLLKICINYDNKKLYKLLLKRYQNYYVLEKKFYEKTVDFEKLVLEEKIYFLKRAHKRGINILEEVTPGVSTNFDSVLLFAIHNECYESAKYLLTLGADVSEEDDYGATVINELLKQGVKEEGELIQTFRRYEFLQEKLEIFRDKFTNYDFEDKEIKKIIEKLNTFHKEYQRIGIEGAETRAPILKQLTSIKNKLKKLKYINGRAVLLYKYIKELQKEKTFIFNPIIDRRGKKRSAAPIDKNNYTYLLKPKAGFYLLPTGKDNETMIFQLLSSLKYELMRNDWTSIQCVILRGLLTKLDPQYDIIKRTIADFGSSEQKSKQYADGSVDQFTLALELKEFNTDYFGEYLSDDSDSEEEQRFQNSSSLNKTMLLAYAQRLTLFAGKDDLVAKKNNKEKTQQKGQLKIVLPEKAEDRSRIFSERTLDKIQHIQHPDGKITEQVHDDLRRLNYLLQNDQLNEATIKQLKTKFFIAQYRGIAYGTDVWSQKKRRVHRKTNEIGKPLFSLAVYKKAKLEFSKPMEELTEEELNSLYSNAGMLHDQLTALRFSGAIKINLTKTNNKASWYENAGVAIQDRYSKNIKDFHDLIKLKLEQFENNELINGIDDAIFLAFYNDKNAFVSTGDVPFHALKYAYGIKFYTGEKHKRLRPRYISSGQAERPYSGKVYVSLHSPLEYTTEQGPMHVPSLNETGKTNIGERITPELETTFPAYLDKDKIVAQHIAKFPSFAGDYKEIYLYKYGLSKELYLLFQKEIKSHKPHSPQAKSIKNLLTLYLCTYHEVCLIEQARVIAEKNNGVLIYRDEFGNFSLYCAKVSHGNKKTQDSIAIYQHRSSLWETNQANNSTKGFMNNILENYDLKPINYKNFTISEVANYLAAYCESSLMVEALEEDYKNNAVNYDKIAKEYLNKSTIISSNESYRRDIQKSIMILCVVAKYLKINLIIHSPYFFKDNFRFTLTNNASFKTIEIYYAGGNNYCHLIPKESVGNILNLKM